MNNKNNPNGVAQVMVFKTELDLPPNKKIVAQRKAAEDKLVCMAKQRGEQLVLQHLASGKCVCENGYVSISHSGNYVAVALADRPVGIDLQRKVKVNFQAVAKKFFTQGEKQAMCLANCEKTFFEIWCKKEALWKSLEIQPPTITTVDTTNATFTQLALNLDGETFFLAVTGDANICLE